jgi:dTDP-4-dehydrorhamnose reductase
MSKYKKIFIAGANGMLGTTLKQITDTSKMFLTDKEISNDIKFCDIRDLKHTTELINEYQPDIILNFAALVDLEYCEQEKDDCYLTNTIAAIHLFNLSKDLNIPYVFISTAGIFGNDKEFYTEEDQPYPLSAYGKSKYYTEQLLQNQGYEKYWIFRAGWMMGGGPEKDKKFINKIMKQINSGAKELFVVDDKLGVPTYTKDFASSILKHIEEELPYGLYNMVSQGEL